MHFFEGKDGLDLISVSTHADFHEQVSSTVATLKIDNPISEYYDSAAASRIQCRMVSQGPSQYMTTHSPSTINYDLYQYRNNSSSSYQQYPSKQYYSGVSPFAEYDENVDYGLQTSPYQLMAPDHMQTTSPSTNYGAPGQLRGWTPAPQLPKSNPLFLEQEQPIYGHGQLPYNNAGNFPMRTTMSSESKGMGLSAMPILPTPISGNDRILPNPTANRPAQMNAFLLRNSDGMVPMQQQTYQTFGNYMATNMLNNGKTSNHNAVSDNAYMPMSSTSPESITSSHIYTGSENSVALGQHQSEIYSPNDGLHYHTSEPSETSYVHSNGSRRESHSSRPTQHDGSLPSHAEGELSNGHHYVPYQHLSANYPTPPMNIPPPAALHPRSSIQSVQ